MGHFPVDLIIRQPCLNSFTLNLIGFTLSLTFSHLLEHNYILHTNIIIHCHTVNMQGGGVGQAHMHSDI